MKASLVGMKASRATFMTGLAKRKEPQMPKATNLFQHSAPAPPGKVRLSLQRCGLISTFTAISGADAFMTERLYAARDTTFLVHPLALMYVSSDTDGAAAGVGGRRSGAAQRP